MPARWIVDTDGLGACAVAEETDGRCRLVAEPRSRTACEKLVAKLRKRDAERLAATRRENGRRLARHRVTA